MHLPFHRVRLAVLPKRDHAECALLLRPTDQRQPPILELAPFVREYRDLDERAAIYVCRDRACRLPTTEVGAALQALSEEAPGTGTAP